jgi:hypothetical protein
VFVDRIAAAPEKETVILELRKKISGFPEG